MSRFILRYRGPGPRPFDVADRIRGLAGARVIDDGPRMLLVEASEEALRALLPGNEWLIAPERSYSLPDPRPKLRRRAR